MKKCLNFSTILFSYLLITVLVISCGGSSGGGGGGTGGSSVPQPEPKDTTCLLPDRADKDSFIAILCSDGVVIGKINKPSDTAYQEVGFLIPSTENAGGAGRTWEVPETGEIQISYSKDYNVTIDQPSSGDYYQSFPAKSVTMAEADGHTAESPLKILTMSSLIDPRLLVSTEYKQLLIGSIYFMPTSTVTTDSIKAVQIIVGLEVKTQEDFISMANLTTISNLGSLVPVHNLRYFLLNDLDLVAPGGEGVKFDDSIIPVANALFSFDGGGHTITLRSEIDTTADDKPAAIIGKVTQDMIFGNFTLNINKPISGSGNVGTIVGYTEAVATSYIRDSKVNINKDITVYKSADNADGYVGGLAGSGNVNAASVVLKTGDGAVIQAFVQNNAEQSFASAVGGLIGKINTSVGVENKDNVVDVTLGVENSGDGFAGHDVSLGGLVGVSYGDYKAVDNLVKLAISRGKLPADFAFNEVGGLLANSDSIRSLNNNLVYADFSNLGKVKLLGGLIGKMKSNDANIYDNMLFIADVFTGSDVQTSFGVAIANLVSSNESTRFHKNFFSSPVTDYSNSKLASFVHTADADITVVQNIILDNKDAAVMFKDGDRLDTIKSQLSVQLSILAEGADSTIAAILKTSHNWDVGSQSYPQLKAPVSQFQSLTKAEIEEAWADTNADLQTKLAARATSQQ